VHKAPSLSQVWQWFSLGVQPRRSVVVVEAVWIVEVAVDEESGTSRPQNKLRASSAARILLPAMPAKSARSSMWAGELAMMVASGNDASPIPSTNSSAPASRRLAAAADNAPAASWELPSVMVRMTRRLLGRRPLADGPGASRFCTAVSPLAVKVPSPELCRLESNPCATTPLAASAKVKATLT